MEGLATDRVAAAQGVERIREFVLAADAWLMVFARQAKLVPFGPERVFGCLIGLDVEAYNLGLGASGRAFEIAPELLRRRLRMCYV